MAFAGQLRQRVRFDRRAETEDAYGNVETSWQEIATVWGSVKPKATGRDETIQAGRLAGIALYTIVVRASSLVRDLTPADRAVIVNDGPIPSGTTFNIRFVGDLDGRGDLLTMDAERDATPPLRVV